MKVRWRVMTHVRPNLLYAYIPESSAAIARVHCVDNKWNVTFKEPNDGPECRLAMAALPDATFSDQQEAINYVEVTARMGAIKE